MIVLRGQPVELDVPSYGLGEHSMVFPGARERVLPVSLCVLHWTASERTGHTGAEQIHRTLVQRGLSVEFAVTNDGVIWQFLDPWAHYGAHASKVNPFSCGVEVSGVGWRKPGRPLLGASALREQYVETIHGWRTTWLDYLPAEHEAVKALALALVDQGLPRYVHLGPWGKRTARDLREMGGFCGHLHCALKGKCDPGSRPLERLNAVLNP